MKKALNLVLGLLMLAPVYAKSFSFTPTPFSQLITPVQIAPAVSVYPQNMLTDFSYYQFAYDTSAPTYDGPNTAYTITIELVLYDQNTGTWSLAAAPSAITITMAAIPSNPVSGSLTFTAGAYTESFTAFFTAAPTGNFTITTNPTTAGAYGINQYIIPTWRL